MPKTTAARAPGGTRVFDRDNSQDNLSRYLDARKLVPTRFRGTDKYLDVVSWNIRFFDHKDPARVKAVSEVLAALNADVFVLLEIAGDGVLEEVVDNLAKAEAGQYSTKYGSTGAQQRVALMWDRDWVRAKVMPCELFGDEPDLMIPGESGTRPVHAFPRLPLWGYFEAAPGDCGDPEGFTFELAGVHLKAQGPGPVVIQWDVFEHLDVFDSQARRELFKRIKKQYSDHLPVVSRFYLTEGA